MPTLADGYLYSQLFGDVDALYHNHLQGAPSLGGTETVFPTPGVGPDVSETTLLAEVSPGQVSQGIYILPDMYGYDNDLTRISPEVAVLDFALLRIGRVTVDGQFSHMVADVRDGRVLTDQLLEQTYDSLTGTALEFYAFDKNIVWNTDSTIQDPFGPVVQTTYLPEIYLLAEMGPLKVNVDDQTVEGRALLAVGNPTGQRSDEWGGWIDFVDADGGGDPPDPPPDDDDPIDPNDPAIVELVETFDQAAAGNLVPDNEPFMDEDFARQLAEVTQGLGTISATYGGDTGTLIDLSKVKAGPYKAQVWSEAESLVSVKSMATILKYTGHALGVAATSLEEYRETGSYSEAAKAGGLALAIALASGGVGLLATKGVAIPIAAAVAAGFPAVLGAGVVLGAGAMAAIWAEATIEWAGANAFPDWWPKSLSNFEAQSLATASVTGGSTQPAWIYDADRNEMIVSLADTNPAAWRETVTRLGLEEVYELAPVDMKIAGDQHENKRDVLFGGNGDDYIVGGAENDFLAGLAGRDTLMGGPGRDTLHGGADADVLKGGGGHDILNGDHGADVLIGDAGSDLLKGALGKDELHGQDGNDTLFGGPGADLLRGGAGHDDLDGGSRNDKLFGEGGDDMLEGRHGADVINGGPGWDYASYASSNAAVAINLAKGVASGGHAQGDTLTDIEFLMGSRFNDTLIGDAGWNILEGGEGHDLIKGGADQDDLRGGAGADVLIGGSGGDFIEGDNGLDTLFGGGGDDWLDGGPGADVLRGGAGLDMANYSASNAGVTISLATGFAAGGQAQGDTLFSIEELQGSVHDDVLVGNNGNNFILGHAGDDVLRGGGGNDFMVGEPGDDDLVGGPGADVLIGGAGHDYLDGGSNNDELLGETGGDWLAGGRGADVLDGGKGLDVADYRASHAGVTVSLVSGFAAGGEARGDTLISIEGLAGSMHDDVLTGNYGGNPLLGYDGNDVLRGGVGNDDLSGGRGNDKLIGGPGWDSFDLHKDHGVDIVEDFTSGEDLFIVYSWSFGGGLVSGDILAAGRFVAGVAPAASGTHGQFLYDTGNGSLSWDGDGAGGDDPVRLAILNGNPALEASDFFLV